jgi:predicted  nucleic acid-binding Zn-ribbon protein
MSITASALRELHRIHQQLGDLREQLARGPRQVRAGEITVRRLEQQVAQTKETLTKSRVACDDKQLQLRDREDRVEDYKRKLNACGSNREYQALREQIAADLQANNVLSDEILEALARIDELEEEAAAAETNLAKAREELQKARNRVDEHQQDLEAELSRVSAELKDAEAALPPDFKADYDRITKARGEEALTQVEGECCASCYRTLSPQTMNELHMGKPVFCKSCGCLLYLPEDRSIEKS